MAALHKFKRRKFKHEPAHHDPTDLMAVPSAIYGGLRETGPVRVFLHERYDEFGHTPGRHVFTVDLSADEMKKAVISLVKCNAPSDIERLMDRAHRVKSKRGKR